MLELGSHADSPIPVLAHLLSTSVHRLVNSHAQGTICVVVVWLKRTVRFRAFSPLQQGQAVQEVVHSQTYPSSRTQEEVSGTKQDVLPSEGYQPFSA
jgi:hypothetical protein